MAPAPEGLAAAGPPIRRSDREQGRRGGLLTLFGRRSAQEARKGCMRRTRAGPQPRQRARRYFFWMVSNGEALKTLSKSSRPSANTILPDGHARAVLRGKELDGDDIPGLH